MNTVDGSAALADFEPGRAARLLAQGGRLIALALVLGLSFASAARADWADDSAQIQQLVQSGEYVAAERFASESLKRGPGTILFAGTGTSTIRYWRARLRLLLGNTDGAIEDAEALIKSKSFLIPGDMGYAVRAVARAQGGDAKGAMVDFDAALESAKSGMMSGLRTYGIIADRAMVKLLLNDLPGAEADLAQALAGNQDAMTMADYIVARRESWTNLRAAIGKLNAGDTRSARELAQTALTILQKSRSTAPTPEFVTTYLVVAQFDRLGAATQAAQAAPAAAPTPDRLVDPAILALLATGPKQTVYWGLATGDADGGGMAIKAVAPDSPSAAAGLRAGDVLLAVNGQAIRTANDWDALRNGFPFFTPLPLSVRRDGSEIAVSIVLPGRVRYVVREIDPTFPIPGVPTEPASTAPSALDALDSFNVLERFILDSRTGKVALIGRYDPNYRSGPIPYLDLLKTALAYPTPRLNIRPTVATARQIREFWEDFATRPRDFPFVQMVQQVQGHPGLERDRQLMIRELARMYAVAPEEYAAWYNFARLDVQRDDNKDVYPPPALRDVIIRAFRTLGYGEAASALNLIYQQTPESAAQALRLLGLGDEAAAIQARGGDAYGALQVAAYLGVDQHTGALSAEGATDLRDEYIAKRMSWQDVVKVAQSVMPYMPKGGKIDVMHRAFNRIVLSNPAGLLAFPALQGASSRIELLDVGEGSQLVRLMFEADYAFKSINTRPELFSRIPGFVTDMEFKEKNLLPHAAPKASAIWMEPLAVDMTVSPGRNVVDFGTTRMQARTGDASSLFDVVAQDPTKAGPYTTWTGNHITSHYEDYARLIPAFHKIREATKIIALAQWLRAENLTVDLGDVAQIQWDMPASFPFVNQISLAYVEQPNGKTQSTTALSTDGGVLFRPRGNWTTMTPSAVSETRATDQLALSAALGRSAVAALGSDNLEQARYLAELSAQAMNGSLSKADIAKLNVAVPEVKAVAVAPVNVQLQKEMLKRTAQQIDALKQNPGSRATVGAALAQLNNVYDSVQSNPASASDYLLKLQTGQIAAPLVTPKPVIPPVSAPVAVAVAGPIIVPPDGGACTVSLTQGETIPPEQKAYLANKLAEARNRLRYINEALRKLGLLNAKQRAEIEKMTSEITKDYEAATERAYDFAVSTLTDLPLAKYADIHSSKIAELENYIKGQNLAHTAPMSDAMRKAMDFDIMQMTALKDRYKEAFESTERMLNIYAGTNYGNDIYKWDQDTRDSGDRKRGIEATRLGAKILLDHPWLEKYLSGKDWFGGNKLWQVVAMGKMAWTASDFFWDIMNQYGAWTPLTNSLLKDLQFNTQAMDQLRAKAQKTSQEIGCIEKLVQK
jgi:membrane-associated protease RseP (regulator of RpoE activity)